MPTAHCSAQLIFFILHNSEPSLRVGTAEFTVGLSTALTNQPLPPQSIEVPFSDALSYVELAGRTERHAVHCVLRFSRESPLTLANKVGFGGELLIASG